MVQFLLTPLREGRPCRPQVRYQVHDFYSRPCGRGDYKYNKALFEKLAFLLTPLREGRHSYLLICHTYTPNFYSRPCGRGDLLALLAFLRAAFISTHAPAGGATLICWLCFRYDIISTHAPAGGATWYSGHCYTIIQSHFYSRPCGRGDPGSKKPDDPTVNISTHAPAGGATEANTEPITITREISTHAPAGGATLLIGNGCGLRPHFYSRPCGRGDRSRPPADLGGSYFYSRPCGRGDPVACDGRACV